MAQVPLWAPGATCRQQQSSATNSALFASLRKGKGQIMQNSLQKGARQKRTTLYGLWAPQLCCSMGDLNAGLVSGVHTTGPGGPSSSAPTVT